MQALGCVGARMCHTTDCPAGIATQKPELRACLDVDVGAERVARFLRASAVPGIAAVKLPPDALKSRVSQVADPPMRYTSFAAISAGWVKVIFKSEPGRQAPRSCR